MRDRDLLLALGLPALLAVLQQQWLWRRPPRLLALTPAAASAGPAALKARFSRPIDKTSLQAGTVLHPAKAHRWHGEGDTVVLSLAAGQKLDTALELLLSGRDRRGLALVPQHWRWDPRPRLLAVTPAPGGGERLQLRDHDGRWRSLTPPLARIQTVEPLGDGSGVVFTAEEPGGGMRVWRLPLRQRPLLPGRGTAGAVPAPQAGRAVALGAGGLAFAHLSTDRRGALLVQAGGPGPGEPSSLYWPAGGGGPRPLAIRAAGPIRLLPEGGAAVVPEPEGLGLHSLPPRAPRRETLPGSRDLSSFCPQAGRALLVRHWPDYRRSLERVEPGRPPRQLWIGAEALLASACAGGGERVWAMLVAGSGRPALTLLALNGEGRVLRRQALPSWELEPGTGLYHDASGNRLLASLRPLGPAGSPPQPPRPVLIDATTLQLQPLPQTARLALWLPAG
ncbi:MAG: hypothetical protein VKJ05_04050 [Synechococcaceae cyanobacterium]|nr:hypothetical protein [Synechococcaceae cyanobacterium]